MLVSIRSRLNFERGKNKNRNLYILLVSYNNNMKLYQRIVTYGLMVAGSIGLLGCDPQQNTQKAPEPVYITGKVKGEKFQRNILDPNSYIFSVNTEHGLKIFRCHGDYSTSNLDALINSGDEVKIKLDPHEKVEDSTFYILITDVVKINGQQLH